MNVWFCSDLHFGHRNIQKFRNFVTSEEDNRLQIVMDWKKKVHHKDVVYVLGDAAFTMDTVHTFGELPGKKYLVRGNHDELDAGVYLKYFEEIYGLRKYKEFWLSHAPIHPLELRGRVNLHGHVHYETVLNSSSRRDPNYFNCCFENIQSINGGALISLDDVRSIIANGL